MNIIVDDVDGTYYVDLVVSPSELKRLKRNEMVTGQMLLKHRKYYMGIRLQGTWDYEEDETIASETQESD